MTTPPSERLSPRIREKCLPRSNVLRAQAYASGALRSSPQQVVDVQQNAGQPIYVIQPANPQVVYLPQYDPTTVYGAGERWLITFGIAIGITALLVSQPWGWGGWGWNWGGRRIYYNRGPWGGWGGGYRPPNIWYRPRPVVYRQSSGIWWELGISAAELPAAKTCEPPGNQPGFSEAGPPREWAGKSAAGEYPATQ